MIRPLIDFFSFYNKGNSLRGQKRKKREKKKEKKKETRKSGTVPRKATEDEGSLYNLVGGEP